MELLLKKQEKDSAAPAIAGAPLTSFSLVSAGEHACCATYPRQSVRKVAVVERMACGLAYKLPQYLTLSRRQIGQTARHRVCHLVDLRTGQDVVRRSCCCGYKDRDYACGNDSISHHNSDLSPRITYLIGEFSWGSTIAILGAIV